MGQYKINPNPNNKYVIKYYIINAGPFFSLDLTLYLQAVSAEVLMVKGGRLATRAELYLFR